MSLPVDSEVIREDRAGEFSEKFAREIEAHEKKIAHFRPPAVGLAHPQLSQTTPAGGS